MDDIALQALGSMTDGFRRDVLKSHDRVNGYAKFQKHSYDYLMTTQLPHIIGEFSSPAIVHNSASTGRRHVISFSNVTMGSPSHREADGKVCSLLPEEARLRQLDYTLLVMIDVVHEVFPLGPSDAPTDDEDSPEWTMHLPNMEKRVVHREVPFFEIPVMVQSRFCALNGISRVPGRGWDGSGLKQPSSECPRDEGGYFIIRGLDRTLQMQESLRTNTSFVFPVKQPNKYGFVCEVRSRYETKMRSTSTLRINITTRKGGTPPVVVISLPFLPTDVPLLAMFRMLGFGARDDMVAFINGPTPLPENVAPHVTAVLRHACEESTDDEIFDSLGRAGTKDTTVEARRKCVTHLLANEFLPHLGLQNTPVELRKKAMYLGMMVRRLLIAYCNAPAGFAGNEIEGMSIKGVDDRDHYANKRLSTAGTMIALLLRQHMRKFIKTMQRTLASLIESRKPLDVGNVVNTQKISADIRYAFRTGNWSVQRTNTSQNVGITQVVNRMSQLALKSQIGRINTPMNRDGKITHPRQAHLSTWGILCPNETPEGVGCGLVKNIAVLVHVRVGTCKRTLESCLYTFMGVQPITPTSAAGYVVMVNGDIVGTHPDPDALAQRARRARRNHIIPYDTSVARTAWGVGIGIDAGCCMRPVFVAENLHLITGVIADNRHTPTEELWTLLLRKGIIEYLDKEEEMEMRIAVTPAEMDADHTHMEISPSTMLGHCARQIPFADRNQAPRNIYQASMGKQAVAVPTLPYADRFDAQMHVPHYTQRPLVETGAEDVEFGMGTNAIVAVMSHTGLNQEDSIIMNQGCVDRGMFRSTHYTTHTSEEQSTGADPECFENPTMCDDISGLRQADYSALDDVGTIQLNTRLAPGTVLVGKTITTQHIEGKTERKRDASLVYNGADDNSRVDKVMLTNNKDGVNCQRVRVRSTRIPIVGDKFCMTPDHDVMTLDGWKPVAEVTCKDRVACLDNGTLVYHNPTGTPAFENTEDLYHIQSQQVDLLVTPGHRMYVSPPNGPFQLIPASDIMGKRVRYMKNASNPNPDFQFVLPAVKNKAEYVVPMDAWLDFFGRWIADGWVSNNSVAICKEPHRSEIRALSGALGYFMYPHGDKNLITDNQLATYLGAINKTLPAWVWDLSERQARVLVHGLVRGDGTVTNSGSMQYFTSSTRLADDVQRLCLHAGWSANKVLRDEAGTCFDREGRIFLSSWCIGIVRSKNQPHVNHGHHLTQVEEMVPHTGMVHCLEVPTEVFYVRRNGKPVWTGNSSRHGQKGTIGALIPQADMPFSMETGMTPDIIINPCALPSRMTIAHLVECVAAKTGVVLGKFVNGEPFRDMSVEHDLCDALHRAGLQRHGNERMISGVSGELMEASVFMGPTFYQRLKHMTADKVHSRATGPKTTITRQPTEGRANHGGFRLGEMERDCLVSHGSSRVLQERYLYASDAYSAPMCTKCGILAEHAHNPGFGVVLNGRAARCRVCGDTDVKDITVPYAYKLLLQELGAMGVAVKHGFK